MIKRIIEKAKISEYNKRKKGIIYSTITTITRGDYTPLEQAEMVNRIVLGIQDVHKSRLIELTDLRKEYKNAIEMMGN